MNLNQSESVSRDQELVSSYLQYLPAIMQEDPFISRFLLAFEKILSGVKDLPSDEKIIQGNSNNVPGLEEVISRVETYFDPQETPEQFLPWLAGWVALSLRDDWELKAKRAFIQQIVKLYRQRGTKDGLTEVLKLYLINSGFGDKVQIVDQFDNFPNYFQVQLTLNDRDPEKYWRQSRIAKAIIDQEKPAHTWYSLKILVPTMQLTKPSKEINCPFKLFASTQNQTFTIEVKITPDQNSTSEINRLAKQLIIQLQGNSTPIIIDSPPPSIDNNNQFFTIKYSLNYQQFQDNLDGFYIKLSNRTDKDFNGNLAVKLYFYINEIEHSETILEQLLNLSPVLKICRQNQDLEIIEGNTIFKQENQPQTVAMRITEYEWTQPYKFKTFTSPKIQKLQPKITAIIEKIDIKAIVEITKPNSVTTDLLNKITLRLQDHVSDSHLLTPDTRIENNKIIIKRRLYYPDFMVKIDRLSVIIKNLNEVDIAGKLIVQVSLDINQGLSTHNLLTNFFTINKPDNILQICRQAEGDGKIDAGKIPTILGTTTLNLLN